MDELSRSLASKEEEIARRDAELAGSHAATQAITRQLAEATANMESMAHELLELRREVGQATHSEEPQEQARSGGGGGQEHADALRALRDALVVEAEGTASLLDKCKALMEGVRRADLGVGGGARGGDGQEGGRGGWPRGGPGGMALRCVVGARGGGHCCVWWGQGAGATVVCGGWGGARGGGREEGTGGQEGG